MNIIDMQFWARPPSPRIGWKTAVRDQKKSGKLSRGWEAGWQEEAEKGDGEEAEEQRREKQQRQSFRRFTFRHLSGKSAVRLHRPDKVVQQSGWEKL